MGYYFNNICIVIAHEYGLEAIEHWLDKFPESFHPRFPKEFVLEGVKVISENNNLNFDNEYFNQIKVWQWVPYLPNLCKSNNGIF